MPRYGRNECETPFSHPFSYPKTLFPDPPPSAGPGPVKSRFSGKMQKSAVPQNPPARRRDCSRAGSSPHLPQFLRPYRGIGRKPTARFCSIYMATTASSPRVAGRVFWQNPGTCRTCAGSRSGSMWGARARRNLTICLYGPAAGRTGPAWSPSERATWGVQDTSTLHYGPQSSVSLPQ